MGVNFIKAPSGHQNSVGICVRPLLSMYVSKFSKMGLVQLVTIGTNFPDVPAWPMRAT